MLVRLGLTLLLAAGCGRVGFGSSDGAVADGGPSPDSSITDGAGEDAPADTSTSDTSTSDGGALPDSIYLEFDSVEFGDTRLFRASDGDLVGDAALTVASPGVWDVTLRYATLSGGVPVSEPKVVIGTLTEEPGDRFLLVTTDVTAEVVLLVAVSGSQWTVTVDESDPRSAGTAGLARVSILDEAPPPPNRTIGRWTLDSFTAAGMTVPARTCTPYLGQWAFANMLFEIDPLAGFIGNQSIIAYSDSACMVETTRSEIRGRGFLVERPGERVDAYVWDVDADVGIYVWYDYDLPAADRLRLFLRGCDPACAPIDVFELVPATGGA